MNFEFGNSVAVTVCDIEGNIIYMNKKSADMFEDQGGYNLLGENLYNCHNENSKRIIKELIDNQKENIYSIEQNGKNRLIYQSPYYENNKMKGLIELVIELPDNLPHYIR